MPRSRRTVWSFKKEVRKASNSKKNVRRASHKRRKVRKRLAYRASVDERNHVFRWDGKAVGLDHLNLDYMLNGTIIQDKIMDPNARVIGFRMQEGGEMALYTPNTVFVTYEDMSRVNDDVQLSFETAISFYINNENNWKAITAEEEDMRFEVPFIDRIQCTGIPLFVVERAGSLVFGGESAKILKRLLQVTPRYIDAAKNPRGQRYKGSVP